MTADQQKYRELKREMGWTNEDVARILGFTPDSVKAVTGPNKPLPAWAKLAIEVLDRVGNGCNWKYVPEK